MFSIMSRCQTRPSENEGIYKFHKLLSNLFYNLPYLIVWWQRWPVPLVQVVQCSSCQPFIEKIDRKIVSRFN